MVTANNTRVRAAGNRRLTPPREWRAWLLCAGALLALSVYYTHYGAASFDEGVVESGGMLTVLARSLAVAAVVLALLPVRRCAVSVLVCVALYLGSAVSFLVVVAIDGAAKDAFFLNTILQLPVLVVLTASVWQIDYARCMRFVCWVLVLQTVGDVLVEEAGTNLWLSGGFIGGVGNPSSFGVLCVTGFTFCLLHPGAGRLRGFLAALLAFGAVMTQSLFAIVSLSLVMVLSLAINRRHRWLWLLFIMVVLFGVLSWLDAASDDMKTRFIERKLYTAGEMLGLVAHNTDSSISVSQRVEMHERTFASIEASPARLLLGHFQGQPYWPMDSQLLTYLGSFGAPMLALFLALHFVWLLRAWRVRAKDGGFAVVALALFGFVFTTNRILDYFPVASVYFLLVAMALLPVSPTPPSSPVRAILTRRL